MNMLVTGADAPPVQFLIRLLSRQHTVRMVTAQDGDLRDEAFAREITQGIDAIVHAAPMVIMEMSEVDNLDHAARGTYVLLKAAQANDVVRFTLLSTLALFDVHEVSFDVKPTWAPQPRATLPHLCAWLAETIAREEAREMGVQCTCLRLSESPSSRELETAAAHFDREFEEDWLVEHIGRHRPAPALPVVRPASRPIKNVVIFGAGGPLATAAVRELAPHYTLRLTDARTFETILNTPAQSEHAPKPDASFASFEWQQVDVTDAAQVMRACAGMDAIINCTVIRREAAGAFRVNAGGAYTVMQAAVLNDIRRVVHTGPYQIGREGAAGYSWDVRIVDDVPARPGGYWDLYMHSKLCGEEIVRAFARQHVLDVPALYFNDFVDPGHSAPVPDNPFIISWADAARAIRAALEAPVLPSPFEIMHINTDAPHGVFPNDKAKRLLHWQPQDDLSRFWRKQFVNRNW
jgi:nucleoside-diphosphate-sugar epimerase